MPSSDLTQHSCTSSLVLCWYSSSRLPSHSTHVYHRFGALSPLGSLSLYYMTRRGRRGQQAGRLQARAKQNKTTPLTRLRSFSLVCSFHLDMGTRSLKSRKKSPLPPRSGSVNHDQDSQMFLSSNASSQGSALDRTTLPVSRRAGHASPSAANGSVLEKEQAREGSRADHQTTKPAGKLSRRDQNAMALLIILC